LKQKEKLSEREKEIQLLRQKYNTGIILLKNAISDMQELLRSPKTGRDILALSRNSFTSLKLSEIEKEKEIQLLHQRDSVNRVEYNYRRDFRNCFSFQ
jgi:hypothetical protein